MWRGVEELLRLTPWILTIICANVIHYRSLWTARDESRATRVIPLRKPNNRIPQPRNRIPQPRDGILQPNNRIPQPYDRIRQPHELLTFDLMQSPRMRKARYEIKLLRYLATSLYLLLFHALIPELHTPYPVTALTLECLIVGVLGGLIAVYLNENHNEAMRTLWRPAEDFGSEVLGDTWDVLRLVGASLVVPVEEELFYHSWMSRYVVTLVRPRGEYGSFVDVGFGEWSWVAWVVANGIKGAYNGKEWRSYFVNGLLFQWMIGRRGLFLDGLITHAVSNLTVGCWVLATNQRQYW